MAKLVKSVPALESLEISLKYWSGAGMGDVTIIETYAQLERALLEQDGLGSNSVAFSVPGSHHKFWEAVLSKSFPIIHERGWIRVSCAGEPLRQIRSVDHV